MHTMSEDVSASMQLSSLRAELACPANAWESAWQIARQNMLGPSLTTFLFKLLHQILPTAERVSRILANQSPHCTRCRLNPPATETLNHAMFDCQTAGAVLLNGLRKFIPNLTPSQHQPIRRAELSSCMDNCSFPLFSLATASRKETSGTHQDQNRHKPAADSSEILEFPKQKF